LGFPSSPAITHDLHGSAIWAFHSEQVGALHFST
jgi:hypothetical protein